MAWIQVHQHLKDHRKLLAAADELDIEPPHMLGLLISFWLWALDNAPRGNLENISDRMISRAAQWNGEPADFVSSMINAGFLDEEKPGELLIHDWQEFTGKLIDQREAEKHRSRRRRAAAAAATPDDRRTTAGQPPDDRKTTGGRLEKTRLENTRLDKSIEDKETPPHTPEGETRPDIQEQRFSEFWDQYPKKVGKAAALKSWKKIKPDAALFDHIMHAVAAAKASDQWRRENGRFIPNPATWLNQGRWDDEPTPPTGPYTPPRPPAGKFDAMAYLGEIIEAEEGDVFT